MGEKPGIANFHFPSTGVRKLGVFSVNLKKVRKIWGPVPRIQWRKKKRKEVVTRRRGRRKAVQLGWGGYKNVL